MICKLSKKKSGLKNQTKKLFCNRKSIKHKDEEGMGSIYLASASFSGGSTSSERLDKVDDVYEGDLGDTGFWRSISDPYIPRQRVYNTISTGSSPHTLRRPQSRQRPHQDLGHLRGGSVSHHTNCSSVFGALHAATAIASGNVSHTSIHSKDRLARSLAPATKLIDSLNITNAYDQRRRQYDDEDLEWKKRFWLNRTLQKREEAFASKQKSATRAMKSALAQRVHDYDAGRSIWGGNIRISPIQHLQRQTNPRRQVIYTDHTIPWGINGSNVMSLSGGIQQQKQIQQVRLSPLQKDIASGGEGEEGGGGEESGYFSSSIGSIDATANSLQVHSRLDNVFLHRLNSPQSLHSHSPSPASPGLSRSTSSTGGSSRSSQRSRSPGRPAGEASMQLDGVFERQKPISTSIVKTRAINVGKVTVLKDLSSLF